MDRRKFIKSVTAAAVCAAIPAAIVGDGISLKSIAHPSRPLQFKGMQLIKPPAHLFYGRSITEMITVEIAQQKKDKIFRSLIATH